MVRAVIKASKGLLRDFSELENLQVSVKSNKFFVTSADLKADKILREELMRARPTYSLLSEESPEIIGEDTSARWIIDPLDGTVNYMHGFPHWAPPVALENATEVVAAVTYEPVKNERFWAEKGIGAYVNNKKIRVSGKRNMSEVLTSVGSFGSPEPNWLPHMHYKSSRRTGSMTLDMAYVAAGRMDLLFSSPAPNVWDVAAGVLLIKEANGIVANRNGATINNYDEISIAGNIDLVHAASKMNLF
jgi:myo-inositol-1(or 4)-monophosphatase